MAPEQFLHVGSTQDDIVGTALVGQRCIPLFGLFAFLGVADVLNPILWLKVSIPNPPFDCRHGLKNQLRTGRSTYVGSCFLFVVIRHTWNRNSLIVFAERNLLVFTIDLMVLL